MQEENSTQDNSRKPVVGNGIGAGLRRLLAALKRSYTLRVPVLFLLACALSYVSEHYIEHLSEQGKDHPGVTQSLFNVRGLYQYVVASWPRRLVPRYTVIVEIDPENDPTAVSLHNICDQREFLSRFVSTLAKYEPKVIVIDKFFTELGCKPDHPSTIALQRAIADVSRKIPIVNSPWLKAHDKMGAMGWGEGFSFALGRNACCG